MAWLQQQSLQSDFTENVRENSGPGQKNEPAMQPVSAANFD
jgi:hypothetical protein